MKYPQEVKDYIYERCKVLEKESWQKKLNAIATEVKKKFWFDIKTEDQIRCVVKRIDSLKQNIAQVNSAVKDNKKYEVIDWNYIIQSKLWPLKFTIEEIDEVFADFSEKWNNLTEEEMIAKYELKVEAWYAIKRAFRLYKKSNVISPFTAESLSEEELDSKIEYATAKHIDSIKRKMVVTHHKQTKKELANAYKILWNIDYFLEHLQTYISEHKPLEVDFSPPVIHNNDTRHFVLSDIHIGKIDTKWVIRRLDELHKRILECPEKNIHITCLWDIAETIVQDWMHAWQIAFWTDAEWGYGFDLMMNIVQIFEKFLMSLFRAWKVVYFKWITGNHWRMTAWKEYDTQRTGELVIYEMIKRWVANTSVSVEYFRKPISTFWYGNLHFVIYHWDGFLDKQKPEQILVAHGAFGKYHVLMSGDKHTLKMSEGKNYTWIKDPALAWQWKYDSDMNLHSEPWYLEIKENSYGTADILIRRLK